jgi:hypothetical protein
MFSADGHERIVVPPRFALVPTADQYDDVVRRLTEEGISPAAGATT